MNQTLQQKPVIEREMTHEISRGECAVRIMRTLGFRPRYSFEIGRINHEFKFVRFFPFMVQTELGTVTHKEIDVAVLGQLIREAETWMLNECQFRENAILEEKIAKEQAKHDRGKPKMQPGLKQLSKQDRAKRQGG